MLFSFIELLNIIQGNYQMESEKVENRYFCESRTSCFGRDAKSRAERGKHAPAIFPLLQFIECVCVQVFVRFFSSGWKVCLFHSWYTTDAPLLQVCASRDQMTASEKWKWTYGFQHFEFNCKNIATLMFDTRGGEKGVKGFSRTVHEIICVAYQKHIYLIKNN